MTETNEAYFLGLLEGEDQPPEPKPSTESPMTDDFFHTANLATGSDPDPKKPQDSSEVREYYALSSQEFVNTSLDGCLGLGSHVVFDCFYSQEFGKSGPIDDHTCATLDTGCQRLAVGFNTLEKYAAKLPQPLRVTLHPEINRFRSIHGVSTSHHVASVPTSLGSKGAFLRPAVLKEGLSQDAPFLISLSFLSHCKATICLDNDQGMTLHLRGTIIPCHLGPTGALRVPLQDFSSGLVNLLASVQQGTEYMPTSEFEILTIQKPMNEQLAGSNSFKELDQSLSRNSQSRHGPGIPQDASEQGGCGNSEAGSDAVNGVSSDFRRRVQCDHRGFDRPERAEGIEPDHELPPGEPRGQPGQDRVPDTFWRTSAMPLPRTLQTLDLPEDRDELREDVLSVPPEDQSPMPVLQMDREPAVPRSWPTGNIELNQKKPSKTIEEVLRSMIQEKIYQQKADTHMTKEIGKTGKQISKHQTKNPGKTEQTYGQDEFEEFLKFKEWQKKSQQK